MSRAGRVQELRERAGSEAMRGAMEVAARQAAYRKLTPDLRKAERDHHAAVEALRANPSCENLAAWIQSRKRLRELQERARRCWM